VFSAGGTTRSFSETMCSSGTRLAAAARRFLAGFPGQLLYAVKCNPHPKVLDALYVGGIRDFDTASLTEIATIAERYPDAHVYFQHPVKSRAAIDNAYRVYGVRDYAIDHPAELEKLGRILKDPESGTIFVRLATPPGYADYDLSSKFGASVEQAVALLRRVAAMGFRPAGSFHVGSQCGSPAAYTDALAIAGEVIRESGVAVAADVDLVDQCVGHDLISRREQARHADIHAGVNVTVDQHARLERTDVPR